MRSGHAGRGCRGAGIVGDGVADHSDRARRRKRRTRPRVPSTDDLPGRSPTKRPARRTGATAIASGRTEFAEATTVRTDSSYKRDHTRLRPCRGFQAGEVDAIYCRLPVISLPIPCKRLRPRREFSFIQGADSPAAHVEDTSSYHSSCTQIDVDSRHPSGWVGTDTERVVPLLPGRRQNPREASWHEIP